MSKQVELKDVPHAVDLLNDAVSSLILAWDALRIVQMLTPEEAKASAMDALVTLNEFMDKWFDGENPLAESSVEEGQDG